MIGFAHVTLSDIHELAPNDHESNHYATKCAALDTEDARLLKQTVASLNPDQVKQFQEELSLAGVYTHGTHVAGIAVEGNPFARVFTATMLWEHRTEPVKPSEALSQRTVDAYRQIVRSFADQQVRVVNMSWRYGVASYEGITVGAVDRAGQETSFSTFGKTVAVHANGFEVESLLPGGDRVKFSGTSMASPQVANLAAKLFALKPELTVAQVREAMIGTSERKGRVNLIHPRHAAQALGITLSP